MSKYLATVVIKNSLLTEQGSGQSERDGTKGKLQGPQHLGWGCEVCFPYKAGGKACKQCRNAQYFISITAKAKLNHSDLLINDFRKTTWVMLKLYLNFTGEKSLEIKGASPSTVTVWFSVFYSRAASTSWLEIVNNWYFMEELILNYHWIISVWC